MKKTIILFIAAFGMSLALQSCLSDDGNYDYTPVPDVSITGLSDSVRAVLQVPQHYSPIVQTTIPEDRLEYCWRIGSDTLVHGKDFDYTFTRVPTSSSPLTFDILDTQNNVRYSKNIDLNVVSPFSTGWAVLVDNNGSPALAFQSLESDKLLYDDVYNTVNHESLTGTPISVKQLVYTDGFTGQRTDRISVLMSGGKSPELDGVSLLRDNYYEDEFRNADPGNLSYISAEYYQSDNAYNIITADGKVYMKVVGSMGEPDDGYFQYPLSGDDSGYQVAPMMAEVNMQGRAISIDELNHRFVYWSPTNLSSTVSPINFNESGSITTTSLDKVEGSAVWIGNKKYNSDGLFYAVTKSDGHYWLYKMFFGYDYSVWDFIFTMQACVQLPDGTVSDESVFAVSPNTPYIYVGTGNKLKAINVESLNNVESAVNDIATFDGDIKSLIFTQDTNILPDLEFTVVISNGNNSSILVVDPTLTSHGQILQRYDGIKGRVVSACRKLM